jgi:hypothetical protein
MPPFDDIPVDNPASETEGTPKSGTTPPSRRSVGPESEDRGGQEAPQNTTPAYAAQTEAAVASDPPKPPGQPPIEVPDPDTQVPIEEPPRPMPVPPNEPPPPIVA